MEIIGHDKIIEFLNLSIGRHTISHAYLFYGPENVGKETVALDFVVNLFTQNLDQADKKKTEEQIVKKVHPDIFWPEKIKDKKNIGVDQIRNLRTNLSLKPFSGLYKVVIMRQAELMTVEAINAFLKTLEEPPYKSVIILLANDLRVIPRTIISRCQLIKFNPVPLSDFQKFLVNKYQLSIVEAETLAKLSFGRPGLVIGWLKENGRIDDYRRQAKDFLKIIDGNLVDKISFVDRHLYEAPFFVWQVILRDLLLIKNNLDPINLDMIAETKALSQLWSEQKIYRALNLIKRAKDLMEMNVNKKMVLDNLLINI